MVSLPIVLQKTLFLDTVLKIWQLLHRTHGPALNRITNDNHLLLKHVNSVLI